MQVADHDPSVEPHRLADPPLVPVDLSDPMVDHPQAASEEDRVRLPGERRAQEAVVEVGDRLGEPRRKQGARGHVHHSRHVAPGLEARSRPDRNLLEAYDVRTVVRRKADHLFEKVAPPRGIGVAVEDVPAPDKHRARIISP
jgi:hypothetical protein